MDRYLRTAIRPAVAFEVDGVLTDPDSQAATVTITKADGTAVVTAAACTRVSTGVYRYNLADQATLNRYTATWTGIFSGDPLSITTEFETVGGFYVTIGQIRARPGLSDTAKYPLAAVIAARTYFEETLEAHAGVAFVPRFARAIIGGSGMAALGFPHYPVRSIISAGTYSGSVLTAYTAPELADLIVPAEDGYVVRRALGSWTSGTQNVVVEYEHGFASPPPDVVDAALVEIEDKLKQDVTSARGNRRQFVAGEGIATIRESGIFETPIANKVAEKYRARYRVPAVA